MAKRVDWMSVRSEYERGGITLRELAAKVGVCERTIFKHSSEESWVESTRIVSAQAYEKIREKMIEERVKQTLSDLKESGVI